MNNADALALFYWLVQESKIEQAIRGLEDEQIRGLSDWLKHDDKGGVPMLIRGLLEAEACRRFLEGGEA